MIIRVRGYHGHRDMWWEDTVDRIAAATRELGGDLKREMRTWDEPVVDDLEFELDHDAVQEVMEYTTDRFEGDGHELSRVRLFDDIGPERDAVGRYVGRTLGRAYIEIADEDTPLSVLAHEIGHDIEHDLARWAMPRDEEGILLTRTFGETAAYLYQLEVADSLDPGETEVAGPDPFDIQESRVWDDLGPALSIDLSEQRQGLYAEAQDALERDNPEQLHAAVSEVASMPPDTGGWLPPWLAETEPEEHMLLEATGYQQLDRHQRALYGVTGAMTGTARVRDDGETILAACERYEGEEALLDGTVRSAAADILEQHPDHTRETVRLYTVGLDASFEEARDQLREDILEQRSDEVYRHAAGELLDDLEGLEQEYQDWLRGMEDPVDAVLDCVRGMDYGSTIDGEPTGFDTYVDIPHGVGYAFAEDLYANGYTTADIVDAPEQYAEMTEDAVRYLIDSQLRDRPDPDLADHLGL